MHNTEFFQQSVFFVNDANEIEETTLESYMREFCEGDPARAWYIREVRESINGDGDNNTVDEQFATKWNVFFINAANEIEETTLESYMREFCEGDSARARYIKEAREGIGGDDDNTVDEQFVTKWEVREGRFSNTTRDRLVSTFETEVEANEFHLNGLYWNYCNKSFDAPFHADTREECEDEIRCRDVF